MKLGSWKHAVAAATMATAGLAAAAGPVRAGQTPLLPAARAPLNITTEADAKVANAPAHAVVPIVASPSVSAPVASAASTFPDLRDLSLSPPAGLRPHATGDVTDPATLLPNERAVVPLPSPAMTGFATLALLGLIGSRKAILRFVS